MGCNVEVYTDGFGPRNASKLSSDVNVRYNYAGCEGLLSIPFSFSPFLGKCFSVVVNQIGIPQKQNGQPV